MSDESEEISMNGIIKPTTKAVWTVEITNLLITSRIARDTMFRNKLKSNAGWEQVLADLKASDCPDEVSTITQLKKKWSNICTKYKELKDSNRCLDSKWPYFTQVDNYFCKENPKTKLKLKSAEPKKPVNSEYSLLLINCRLCQEMEGVHSLQEDQELCEKIDDCTALKMTEDLELLPNNICEPCRHTIERYHKFLIQCRRIDKKLRKTIIVKPENLVKTELIDSYNCEECPMSLSSAEELVEHMNSHRKNSIRFQCDFCSRNFSKLSNFYMHMKIHDGVNKEEEEKKIVRQEETLDDPGITPPLHGDEEGNDNEHYIIEEVLIDDPGDEEPNEEISNEIEIEQKPPDEQIEEEVDPPEVKKKEKNKIKPFHCDLCSKSFVRACDLNIHINKHNGVKHTCPRQDCNKSYTTIHCLRIHERKHLGLHPFLCVICGKGFVTKSGLKNHEKIHNEIKEYVCNLCSRGFSTRGNLSTHKKRHHLGFKYYCSQCPKSFLSKCTLDRHELIHAGLKEFACDTCSSSFYTKKELIKHQRYHQGIRLHHCSLCFKGFYEKHHLTIHMRSHTGERPYQCKIPGCGKAFTASQKLARHTRRVH